MTQTLISIADLNARASAARGHEIELEYPKGTGLGVFFIILGDQAQTVEDFEVDLADKRAEESLASAKEGKASSRSTKAVLRDNLERAVIRVAGWRGIKEDFTPDALRLLLQQNPDFVDQVLAESRSRGNFTKA